MKKIIQALLKSTAGQILLRVILKEYATEILGKFVKHLSENVRKKYGNSDRATHVIKYLADLDDHTLEFLDMEFDRLENLTVKPKS